MRGRIIGLVAAVGLAVAMAGLPLDAAAQQQGQGGQQTGEEQPRGATSETMPAPAAGSLSRVQIRAELREAGLEQAQIQELERDGFQPDEVRQAVENAYRERGQREARELAERVRQLARDEGAQGETGSRPQQGQGEGQGQGGPR